MGVMAGLAYAVSANAKIDIGYRYVNMGAFAAGSPKKDGQISGVPHGTSVFA